MSKPNSINIDQKDLQQQDQRQYDYHDYSQQGQNEEESEQLSIFAQVPNLLKQLQQAQLKNKNDKDRQNNIESFEDDELQDQSPSTQTILRPQNASLFKRFKRFRYQAYQQSETISKLIIEKICTGGSLRLTSLLQQLEDSKLRHKDLKYQFAVICKGIFQDILKEICKFLTKQWSTEIKSFSYNQTQLLMKAFMRCTKILTAEQFDTFSKFAKFTFAFEKVELQNKAVFRLYKRLSSLADELIEADLKSKQKQRILNIFYNSSTPNKSNKIPHVKTEVNIFNRRKCNTMKEINQIWNEEHNNFLKDAYNTVSGFGQIRELFIKKFPKYKNLWTINAISIKFGYLVKHALKILSKTAYNLKSKIKIADMAVITARLFRIISQQRIANAVKSQLIRFLDDTQNIPLIITLVERINQLQEQNKRRQLSQKFQKDDSNLQDETEEMDLLWEKVARQN